MQSPFLWWFLHSSHGWDHSWQWLDSAVEFLLCWKYIFLAVKHWTWWICCMTRPASLRAGSKRSLALCIRRATFWTPTITACWLSVALCTVCMPMLCAGCLLSGVWQLVRSLTPNKVFTRAATLCNPCSFFGTYNMLHEQLNPMGRLGCTLLSLILSKPMTTPRDALWKHLFFFFLGGVTATAPSRDLTDNKGAGMRVRLRCFHSASLGMVS